jgi:nicotinamide-nucleotide amidase
MKVSEENLLKLADKVGQLLKQKNLILATAESCTGGQVAEVITSIPGSSAWFDRGFVTYSNQAKQEMLGINQNIIAKYGAVSDETARAMAEGALQYSQAKIALAITGIAGPDGGTNDKPVGTVWIAWAIAGKLLQAELFHLVGDRLEIRRQATQMALERVVDLINSTY